MFGKKSRIAFMLICSLSGSVYAYDAGVVDFEVLCNENRFHYVTQSIFVEPGQQLDLQLKKTRDQSIKMATNMGDIKQYSPDKASIQAPNATGIYRFDFQVGTQKMRLNVFVMVPYNRIVDHKLGTYRIGRYPDSIKSSKRHYSRPKGFVQVTKANKDQYITPHFKLGQFLCKQSGRYPKYVVLDEKLLEKLEMLLEEINKEGMHCQTLAVLSGYRTPYYNKILGNVKYSAHVWGKAADVYVDCDYDGRMDDLNKDGFYNYKDAVVLYRIVERMEKRNVLQPVIGGLGLYDKNSNHGAFVHIDVRGYRARWGHRPSPAHAQKNGKNKRNKKSNL